MTKKQYDRLVKIDKELMKLYHELRGKEYAVDLLLLACDVGKVRSRYDGSEWYKLLWDNYVKEVFKSIGK